jgi:hypothetical protein
MLSFLLPFHFDISAGGGKIGSTAILLILKNL